METLMLTCSPHTASSAAVTLTIQSASAGSGTDAPPPGRGLKSAEPYKYAVYQAEIPFPRHGFNFESASAGSGPP
eukprot:1158433-Pelagomonas_calceolata.AAC.10